MERFPPCKFRFIFGELSQDVQVDFTTPQTLRDVIDGAGERVPDEGSVFSSPRIASALESDSDAPWSLRFELKDVRGKSFSQDEFLRLTPEDIVIMVEVPTDPVSIAIALEKRELEDDAPSKSDA
jgi:hypothetical protein